MKEITKVLNEIKRKAIKEIKDSTVEAIVDRVWLQPGRPQLLVIASTDGALVRSELLNRIERELPEKGIKPLRLSGLLDPFLEKVESEVSGEGERAILLDEAPLVPNLEGALRRYPTPWVVTAHLQEWIRSPLPAELYQIPKEVPFEPYIKVEMPEEPPLSVVFTLAGLGISLPISLICRALDIDRKQIEENEILKVETIGGMEYLVPVSEEPLSRISEDVLRDQARRKTFLQRLRDILGAAEPPEAPPIVAMLRRLSLRCGRSLTRRVVRDVYLKHLWNKNRPRTLTWFRLYEQLGLHHQAREVLEIALEKAPDDLHLRHAKAALLAKEGRFEQALYDLTELKRQYPNSVHVLHSMADLLRKTGELDEAARLLTEALEIAPDNVLVLTDLGLVAAERKAFEEAEGHFREAISWSPGNAVVLNAWARAKSKQGEFDEAIKLLKQAIYIDHWNPRHYVDLAVRYKERGHLEKALGEIRLALEADFLNPYALVTKADIETERENWEEAAKVLDEALEMEETAHAYTAYGVLEHRRGNLQEAVNYFRRALRLEPNNVHARVAWAELLLQDNDPHGANAVLERIQFKTIPMDSRVVTLNIKAKVHSAWHQFTKAMRYLEESIKIDPQNVITLNTWGDIERQWAEWLKTKGQGEEAEKHLNLAKGKYEEALGIDPKNAYTHAVYASFLEEQGQLKEALRYLKQALEMGLDIPEVRQRHEAIRKRLTTFHAEV